MQKNLLPVNKWKVSSMKDTILTFGITCFNENQQLKLREFLNFKTHTYKKKGYNKILQPFNKSNQTIMNTYYFLVSWTNFNSYKVITSSSIFYSNHSWATVIYSFTILYIFKIVYTTYGCI